MTDYGCMVEDCDRPSHDATICGSCQAGLERDLGEAGALQAELDVHLTRQSVMGEREGGRSAEKPLPYDAGASEAAVVLRSALVGWVRVLMAEKYAQTLAGPFCDACLHVSCSRARAQRWPADTIPAMAAKLLGEVHWLRVHEAGHEAVDEIGSAVRLARRTIDRQPPRFYAGPCTTDGCDGQLYARPTAAEVHCRKCDTAYDVTARQEWLRDSLDGHLGTAVEISALCRVLLGDLVTQAMIRGYAHRGSIAAHGEAKDHRGRTVALYRIGEVMTAAAKAGSDPRSRREANRAAKEAEGSAA